MEMISKEIAKYFSRKTIYYENSGSLKNTVIENIKNINIHNISSFHYYSQKANKVSYIGTGLLITSLINAVFSPLSCINYKNGDYNNNLYYKSLAACGIDFFLGISVAIIFNKNKSFSINNNPTY